MSERKKYMEKPETRIRCLQEVTTIRSSINSATCKNAKALVISHQVAIRYLHALKLKIRDTHLRRKFANKSQTFREWVEVVERNKGGPSLELLFSEFSVSLNKRKKGKKHDKQGRKLH